MARAKAAPASAAMLEGRLPDGSSRFAAVDPAAHHVAGKVAERRFGALLCPFTAEAEARAALQRAGAVLQ